MGILGKKGFPESYPVPPAAPKRILPMLGKFALFLPNIGKTAFHASGRQAECEITKKHGWTPYPPKP
jgi:hypothetical protein